ncbi:hypothetical protein AMTRI_Chr05g71700 [Amborella trichopoda]
MHTPPLIFLHSDASWMLIVYHDILMRSTLIFVFTYGVLLLLPNDSYFDSATIMVLFFILVGKQQNLPLPWGEADNLVDSVKSKYTG